MSEKFSPTLRIGDLSDFIAPSQACVVSLKGLKSNTKKPDKSEVSIAKKQQTEPVKISLKDCLACSGCITSAETVMLEKQSLGEFLSNIDRGKVVIVSLSPQSRGSLAVHFGISPLQVFRKLTSFFKSLGVKAVFDTSCSRDLTLIETCNEFVMRYKQNQSKDDEKSKSALPMLSSACPGWICYAEKQLGSYVLPYISSVKSPQQTIGATIKHHICQKMGLRPDEIYHVTVMPCYDKKLEAARDDFVSEVESKEESNESGIRITEVDSVLTSGEVLDLIKLKAVDFTALEDHPLDKIKVKMQKCDYHFVEVMACPSGCLNGGGQIKPMPGQNPKDLLQSLETVYMENVLVADPFENPLVKSLYDEWLEEPGSQKAKRFLHTAYHPVVKSVTAQLHNW
uniref:Iron hydrogenase small subunit domain-containing protein n=1 Tax=Manihot esculenta TaxID=3983 RepID=A0A2C9VAI8_MANES